MQSGKAIQIQVKTLGMPVISEVRRTLELSQRSPGRPVVLTWVAETTQKAYEFTAVIPVAKPGLGGVKFQATSVPELTLTAKPLAGGNQELVWNYVSGDAELVYHLIHTELNGGNKKEESSTFFGFSDPGGASGSYNTVSREMAAAHVNDQQRTTGSVGMKLEGELTEIDLSNLLQSIAMCKMTGCMKVHNDDAAASLFMDKGNLTHAVIVHSQAVSALGAEVEGDEAVLELLLLDKGSFQFHPQFETHQRTISRPLQMYLLEGAALRDHYDRLFQLGFEMDARFEKTDSGLTFEEFQVRLKEGIPADMNLLKQFYQAFDGQVTFRQILRQEPMKKSAWAPVMYNLLTCKLIKVAAAKEDVAAKTNIDTDSIDSMLLMARQHLVHEETDLMVYPLFLHHVDQELTRFDLKGLPVSLVSFEVWLQVGPVFEAVTIQDIKDMVNRIRGVLNRCDLVGHFMETHFALLLPFQNTIGACLTAKRVLDAIVEGPFERTQNPQNVMVMMGVSSVPEICCELRTLLTTVEEARKMASNSGVHIKAYKSVLTKTHGSLRAMPRP